MRAIKIEQDLRTPSEWEAWAKAKIENKPRHLTQEELNELELGDTIEIDPKNPFKQKIIKDKTLESIPPNFIG
jgi:hypothetical protein